MGRDDRERDDGPLRDGSPSPGDDRDAEHAGARDARGRRAVRLLQGYVWHPRDATIDLADHLPTTLGEDVHVLWDGMPAAPFTFFDDGTLSATQRVYQLTVLRFVEAGEDPATLLTWVAEKLQRALEGTPPSVGWQLLDDLRDVF
jgi:hypothetical protein